jgi:hypothetical protein
MKPTNEPAKPAIGPADKSKVWRKRTAAWSRWLHLYLSMLSFLVVLFFAVTGLTLNHVEWFDGQQTERKATGILPAAWVNTPDTAAIKKLQIAERLRQSYRVQGSVSDFIVEDDQCAVSFKGPGYSADAFINRHDGSFKLTEQRQGLVAVLNDLHKGRNAGSAWFWFIDLFAVACVLFSVTGQISILR